MEKRIKRPNGYWNNLANCKVEAEKYSTRNTWQKGNPLSYRWAAQNSWLEECSAHMTASRKADGYWTLDRCQEEAKKYKTKVEWRLEGRASYSAANRNRWISKCCEHMENPGLWFGPAAILETLFSYEIRHEVEYRFKDSPEISRRPFDFYLPDYNLIIEFHGDQHLIGWGRRDEDAKSIQSRDAFKKNWAKENGINFLEIRQWEVKSKDEIQETVLERLKSLSLILPAPQLVKRELTKAELQKVKSRLKWTKEACISAAQKYSNIKDWQAGSAGSYQAAFKKEWLKDCCTHMQRKLHQKNHWNLAACIADAKTYKTKSEWQQAKRSGYSIAAKNGWIEQCTAHMEPDMRKIPIQRIWTYEKCLELAKSCTSRAEFKKASGSAYQRARVRGWLEDCCAHMNGDSKK